MAELTSPLTGGIRAVRNTVPSSVFTSGAVSTPAQPDPVTTNLISQNSLALTSVSRQLSNISRRVDGLGNGLAVVKNQLEVSAAIERRREQAKQNRERILAEQGLREGKESAIETRIQNALFTPIQRLAATTRGLLSRLGDFFFALAGGWLTNKTIQVIKALSDKNGAATKKLVFDIGLNLAAVVGLLRLFPGKFRIISGVLVALRNTALGAIAGGILVAGFRAVFKILQSVSKFVSDKLYDITGIRLGAPPPKPQGGTETGGTDSDSGSEPKKFNFGYSSSGGDSSTVTETDTSDGTTSGGTDGGSGSSGTTGGTTGSNSTTKSGGTEPKKNFGDSIMNFLFGEKINEGDISSNNTTFSETKADSDLISSDSGSSTSSASAESVKGINRKSDNKIAEQISVDPDEVKPFSFGMNMASATTTPPNEGFDDAPIEVSGGSVPIPVIPSSNNDNNYIYTALKNYQVMAA